MITIKNKDSIRRMEEAGRLLAQALDAVALRIVPGVTTLDLDTAMAEELKKRELVSKMKGYMGYKHVTCISLNDEVVHGIPTQQRVVAEGDLVKIDVCAAWKDYCADMARCFVVGNVSDVTHKLIAVARQSLDAGIAQARVGNRLSDISWAIQQEVERNGFSVVRDFAGHGIGRHMHEDPEILNYGEPGRGPLLRAGMAFALEPMIAVGSYEVYVCRDGWTVKTVDKSLAAHVEDTVVITDGEPLVTTRHAN